MYKIVDVDGDGSCFFRSIYKVLKSQKHALTFKVKEDDFVENMRNLLQTVVMKKEDGGIISEVYSHLKTVDKLSYNEIIKSSFPSWFVTNFKSLPRTEAVFRQKYANNIIQFHHWASEIEVRLVEYYFKKHHGLSIRIYNKTPAKVFSFKKDTIYLLNRGEYHYNAIIIQNAKSPKPCNEYQIRNPETNRCVSKTSCKGYEIIAKSYKN